MALLTEAEINAIERLCRALRFDDPPAWEVSFRGVQNRPYNQPGDVLFIMCPDCRMQAYGKQIKIGRNASGSQRYKCRLCGKKYTPKAL